MSQQQGTAFIAWGVSTGGVAFITSPQGVDYSLESDFAEIKGSDGDGDAYCHYNPMEKVTVTGYTTAATLPAVGATVTPTNTNYPDQLNSRKYSVTAVRVRETNTDWTTLEVDLFRTPTVAPA